MNYYIELTLEANHKITLYKLWSQVYMQMHLALTKHQNVNGKVEYGISFPVYRFDKQHGIGFIGDKLRIFAKTEAELVALDLSQWLKRLTDYVHITSIREVPKTIHQYAVYRRKQTKGTNRLRQKVEQYAQYYANQHNVSYEEAVKRYGHMSVKETHLPFIEMLSLTSEQRFKLFIDKQLIDTPSKGMSFTTYGLSQNSAVPEF